MTLIDLWDAISLLGGSSLALMALAVAYRIVGMWLAVRYGYRFTVGKTVFEPANAARKVKLPKVAPSMLEGPSEQP